MQPRCFSRGFAAMLVVLALCPSWVHAGTGLPPASSVVDCAADDGSHIGGSTGCSIDHSVASVTELPFVSLAASAAYSGSGPASSGGFAVLNFNFAVVGGTKDTVVPIDIDAMLQQSTVNADMAPAYGFAQVIVTTPRSSVGMVICSSGCVDSANSFVGTLQVNALAGETGGNTVTLEIEALAGGYASIPPNSASASADPRIYVDPGFADAGAYSIVLSDGVGNGVAPVPEPGTWALMLGGLVCGGLRVKLLRRA